MHSFFVVSKLAAAVAGLKTAGLTFDELTDGDGVEDINRKNYNTTSNDNINNNNNPNRFFSLPRTLNNNTNGQRTQALSCININATSLNASKKSELEAFAAIEQPHLIFISEMVRDLIRSDSLVDSVSTSTRSSFFLRKS